MKETYAAALAFVLNQEGNFSDDPADSGGPTLHGITFRELLAWRKAHGIPVTPPSTHAAEIALIKSMTAQEQAEIYRFSYWDKIAGDQLPVPLDLITFDAAVNMGVGTALKMLSLAADLPAQFRPSAALVTRLQQKVAVGKLEEVEEKEFALRIARYHAIVAAHSQDSVFLKGWLNRVAAARAAAVSAVKAVTPKGA